MKFIVDAMAGRLAKWMRILGIDTEYEKSGDMEKLLKRARSENRVILTRNLSFRKIRTEGVNIHFLSSEKTFYQLREIIEKFNLIKEIKPFSRCSECNEILNDIKKEEVKGRVPFFVYQTQEHFSICPSCGRIYWSGTHRKAMEKRINQILGYKGGDSF
jgi:hypothetical protein